jgi:hypothetical protein
MFAVIHSRRDHADSAGRGIGALDIDGKTLLARQIDWLRASGASAVVVEVCPSDHAHVRALRTKTSAPVVTVPTREAIGPRALATRAGVPPRSAFVAIADNVLGVDDLLETFVTHARSGALVMYDAPRGVALAYGSVHIYGELGGPPALANGAGWAARIQTAADALALGSALRRGRLSASGLAPRAPCEGGDDSDDDPGPPSGVHRITRLRPLEVAAYERIARAAGCWPPRSIG